MGTLTALIVGILAIVGAILGSFKIGKRTGVNQSENKAALNKVNEDVKRAEETVITLRKVQDAKNEISNGADADIDKRLRDEWSRD